MNCCLSEQLIETFCNLIKRGLPADAACDYLGIGETAYYGWLRKGKKYLESEESSTKPEEIMYGLFVQKFKQATAEYRLNLVDELAAAGPKSWMKPLAILERRDRRSFSRKEPLGGGDETIDPDEKFL